MNEKLKVLDLFSGIGGFSLGLERTGGFETVAFCEIEEFPRRVLAKHWPDVPCHNDVRELKSDAVGPVDVICGGYPCQPFSTAGQRKGAEDDRHLWPEVHRLVASIRPRWCIFENVAGHISMGLDQVLSDLESEGYTAWPLVIPAVAVGASHRRDRVWIVGYTEHNGRDGTYKNSGGVGGEQQGVCEIGEFEETSSEPRDVADADSAGREEQRCALTNGAQYEAAERGSRWEPEPSVGRMANGVPKRVDRLRCLGNAVVPQIPEMIGNAILMAERDRDAHTQGEMI